MSNTVEVFAFTVEYFDTNASLLKQYRLNYFMDTTIEILSADRTKTILNRIPYKELNVGMLYIGSSVTIFSRQYHIVDYADNGTRNRYEALCGKAFGVIKASAMGCVGDILGAIRKNGYVIADLKTIVGEDGEVVCGVLATSEKHGTVESVEVFGELMADMTATYGDCYAAATPEAVKEEAAEFFGEGSYTNSFSGEESSLCLIKPHIIKEGKLGPIIKAIQEAGFKFACMQMFYLDRECAVEFFDVYRGVLPRYEEVAKHLIDGPVVALQIVGDNAVEEFREMCGPTNVELAKVLRPKTFRATFGKDIAMNAVHCTDLPEDGQLECKYFFDILAQI